MTLKPDLSIIIPAHNGGELILACVDELAGNLRSADQVIVVDNGSRDATAVHLKNLWGDGIELYVFRRALGFARACNIGATHARREYLVFMNQDVIIDDTTISAVRTAIITHPDSIIGARIHEPGGRTIQHMGGLVLPNCITEHVGRGETDMKAPSAPVIRCDYVTGAFMVVSRSIFDNLGGFDVRFGPAYFEETDLCFRAAERGIRSIVVRDITVRHFEAQTSGTDSLKYAFRYHQNRLRFVAKHVTLRDIVSTCIPAERVWWRTPLPPNARRGAFLAYLLILLELPRWVWQRMREKPRYSPQEVTR